MNFPLPLKGSARPDHRKLVEETWELAVGRILSQEHLLSRWVVARRWHDMHRYHGTRPDASGIRRMLRWVKIEVNYRRRNQKRHATAYSDGRITINHLFLDRVLSDGVEGKAFLLDMVLHELAHEVEYYYRRVSGHKQTWKEISGIFGSVPQGSMPYKRRMTLVKLGPLWPLVSGIVPTPEEVRDLPYAAASTSDVSITSTSATGFVRQAMEQGMDEAEMESRFNQRWPKRGSFHRTLRKIKRERRNR